MPHNALIEQLPHRRMEAWKWTDVRGAVLSDASGLAQAGTPEFDVPEGVFISQGEGHKGTGVMPSLAAKFAGESWNIYVPANAQIDGVLSIDNLTCGHVRIAIMVDKGATLAIQENYAGTQGGFSNLDLQVHLAQGARLSRTVMHHDEGDHCRASHAHIAAETDAHFSQHTLSFGGGLARLETRMTVEGTGVQADIHGAYLLGDKRHCDMTSHIDLGAENARIRQSVKGVVTDKARGVFQGKFHVRRPAQLTDAEMRHDAIMLSDTCEIRSKPELEIYADDVACAHGNTVGALDESALFYMRQRGIPAKQARALLTQAFVAQSFDGMVDNADFMTRITEWLEHNS